MQTRVPEKYIGSITRTPRATDPAWNTPHARFVSAPVAVTRAYRDRTFAPLPGYLPHWLGLGVGVSVLGLWLGYYEQIRYEMLF